MYDCANVSTQVPSQTKNFQKSGDPKVQIAEGDITKGSCDNKSIEIVQI